MRNRFDVRDTHCTGRDSVCPANLPESSQKPGTPTPAGSFSVTQLGDKADKVGKDDNFRGLTLFDNVLYYTKGSGSNGVNTVYFLDTTGKACPNGTVSIWAVTSTVSGGGDQGADPNKLVEITDPLAATAPAAREAFTTVVPARYDQVVRGVSFTPGTLVGR